MIAEQLAKEFNMRAKEVDATITLLDEGNTIPFIARYRKDQTGALDDQRLRAFADALQKKRQLEERRADVSRLIDEQGKLTEKLKAAIAAAETVTALDDIYRPYRPKRKTRASEARARGLEPLAKALLSDATQKELDALAAQLAGDNDEPLDLSAAYQGACDIIAEDFAERADVRSVLRNHLARHLVLESRPGKAPDARYTEYEDYQEALAEMPAHRVLAINRAERADALQVSGFIDEERIVDVLYHELIRGINPTAKERLRATAHDAWKRLLRPSLEKEVRRERSIWAEDESIDLFRSNLRELLLAAVISGHRVLGFDPGYRNGCKLAVVDATGAYLDSAVIYPTKPRSDEAGSAKILADLVRRHGVDLIAIGNGTASRESERFVAKVVEEEGLDCAWIIVSEAGASVYSASEAAAEEFPDLDVAVRSAVSIARRVQDPLAELVKIDPKAIGVGQYQHDVDQKKLASALDAVVEDCVNYVGVDLNTASVELLTHIAGLSKGVAKEIVLWRNENGRFINRKNLLKVKKLGPKTFEQCAGFLRISDGDEPLDNTQVHPESYSKVRDLAKRYHLPPSPQLAKIAAGEDIHKLADSLDLGPETLRDILEALQKPGRDPRDSMPQPVLRHDLLRIEDLQEGMLLEGVVRNVAAFGAFVDIGLHNDGLVHISELSERFVKDPRQVVHVGQLVQVRVITIDAKRGRIGLSMKGVAQPEEATG